MKHLDIDSRISTGSAATDPAAIEARGVDSYAALSSSLRHLLGRRTADQLMPRSDRRVNLIGESHARGAAQPSIAKNTLSRDARRRSARIRQQYHADLLRALTGAA